MTKSQKLAMLLLTVGTLLLVAAVLHHDGRDSLQDSKINSLFTTDGEILQVNSTHSEGIAQLFDRVRKLEHRLDTGDFAQPVPRRRIGSAPEFPGDAPQN